MRNQQGFTLIELVVVIVILGILAAVAVPKFVNMQVDARQATLRGMLGAVRSASSLTHAQSLIRGDSAVTVEGTTISMVAGYPDATGTGIRAAVEIDGFYFVAASGDDPAYFYVGDNDDRDDCRVSYTAAVAATADAQAVPPVIEIADGEGACSN